MEILHYEYDGFNLNEIISAKEILEEKIEKTNFDIVAKDLLNKKHEWFNLDFFD